MLDTLLQDLRFAWRLMHRNPGHATAAMLTLALGIGFNVAIFSVVHGVLLQPLPYEEPERLVRIHEGNPLLGSGIHPVAPATFLDWQEENPVFDRLAAYHWRSVTLTGERRPERVAAAVISPGLMPLLGVDPAFGRSFAREEAAPGRDAVVILSHGLWQSRYAGDGSVLGRTLTVDGREHTIIGVMPARFAFPDEGIGCWLPMALDRSNPGSRGDHFLRVVARLMPGSSAAEAEAGMDALAAHLALEYPELEGWDTVVVPLDEAVIGRVAPALWILWGAVGFVMLIVCGNVANLTLTRSVARSREIAIRSSLGARRSRIVRLLLTESLLLAVVGGGLGVLIAMWVLPSLVAMSADAIPRVGEIGIDRAVLAYAVGLALLTGLLSGLLPALQMTRRDMSVALNAGDRSGATAGSARLRGLLVVTELALALVLLAGAGLMLRTFSGLQQVDPGFRAADRLLTFRLQLPEARYPSSHQVSGFYGDLAERLAALPGVEAAGAVQVLPTMGTYYNRFGLVGRQAPDGTQVTSALYRAATPGYLRTMGIPLLRGRGLTSRDRRDTPPVVLVNETFSRTYYPDGDALGEQLDFGARVEIVGVVGDVKHLGLDAEPRPAVYISSAQDDTHRSMALVVRTRGKPAALMPAVRTLVASLDGELPIYAVRTGDEILGSSIAQRRFAMTLLGLFAGLALALAVVGTYGVISYSTGLRAHEIGVRMALGAQRFDVLRTILWQGMKLALAGLAIGLGGALVLTRLLQGLLFGVSATDPATLAGVAAILFLAAVLASFIPARRAAGISPVRALRCD